MSDPDPLRRALLRHGWSAGAAGLLAGGGLLSACGERSANANANANASAASSSGGTAATSATPAVEGQPRRSSGAVHFGVIETGQAGNLDAHKPVGSGAFRGWALYAKLWEWGLDGLPTLALAEEAQVNRDGTEWTIRLKPGLEFHHGKTIDADDVIFSLRRLTDPALASPYAAYLYSLRRDEVRKLDDRTVRIPFAKGQGLVALAECWMSWGGIVPVDYHPVTNVVGAGPYRLKSFTPGQRSVFTRFDNYFKPGQPWFDEVHIHDFADQTARLQALQAGQIDIAPGIAAEQLQFLERDPRLRVVASQTDAWQSLDMNLSKAPFDKPEVRRAFRLIADRQELVDRVLQGRGRVANDLYSPGDPVYDHDIPQRRRDLAEARRLLAQAGYPNGLDVELVTPGSKAALVFAQQAKAAGVTVTVKQVDASTFTGPNRAGWTFSTGAGVSRPFLLTVQQHDGPRAANNKTHFRDPRFGELITAALAQADLEQRKALVHEAQRIQHDSGGLLIWGFADVLDAVSTRIGGVTPDRTGFAAWRTDRIWRLEDA
ncbi:ABC transporter substrate-binding protein [Roseateles aquatilis]|uniref:ABC transporter substrate-binding protein n=2 Tax=Roseateles aquatilis TaxID=431061 RepID=A0A246JGW4_9BURK|nr:ABC transporter substrate-binding protein [Roseateles aquatilis]